MKLLYFLDFIHFKETGRSVTSQRYYAWEFGPVPKDFWIEIKENKQADFVEAVSEIKKEIPGEEAKESYLFKAIKKFDDKLFSKRELRILKDVSEIFWDALAQDMVETTHVDNTPWHQIWEIEGKKYGSIDYMLAFKSKKLAEITPEEAQERLNEVNEVYQDLGLY